MHMHVLRCGHALRELVHRLGQEADGEAGQRDARVLDDLAEGVGEVHVVGGRLLVPMEDPAQPPLPDTALIGQQHDRRRLDPSLGTLLRALLHPPLRSVPLHVDVIEVLQWQADLGSRVARCRHAAVDAVPEQHLHQVLHGLHRLHRTPRR